MTRPKGYHHSLETRQKMSESAKKRCQPPILSKDELTHLCLIENKSDIKIGNLFGVKSHIIRHLRRLYKIFPTSELLALRNREGRFGKRASPETRTKHSLAIMGDKNPNWGKPKSPETKAKLRIAQLGEKNPSWKGGRRFDNFGYVKILNHAHPHHDIDGYVLEHRLIVEKQISRLLSPKEMCHHINKIKDDNRPENLMAFRTQGIHLRFERNCPIAPEDIIFDGRNL